MRRVSVSKIQFFIRMSQIDDLTDKQISELRDEIDIERMNCKVLVIEFPHEKTFRNILRDLDVIECMIVERSPVTLKDIHYEYGEDLVDVMEDVINSKVSLERAKYLLRNRDSKGRVIRNFNISPNDTRETYPDGMTAGEFIYITKIIGDNTEKGVEKGLDFVIGLARSSWKAI